MEWQPIETAPKDGTEVLLYVQSLFDDYAVAHWNEKEQCWDVINADYVDVLEFGSPTHWMPPPAPPEAD